MAVNASTNKITLENVTGLGDPLTSSLYALTFDLPTGVTRIGAGLDSSNDEAAGLEGSRMLQIACQSVTLPAKTIEPTPLEVHAHTLRFTGRVTFDGVLTVTFVENRNMAIYRQLYEWQKSAKSHTTQLGLYKSQYATDATLEVFDNSGYAKAEYDIKKLWLSGLPEVPFDQNDTLITLTATFAFDWFEQTKPIADTGTL